jgi:acetyl-CoA C-acetyltransferase
MSDIVIAGIGQIPVGEHYSIGLREMGVRALVQALHDSGDLKPDALYIGNLLSSMISHQSNLGALFTDYANLEGIEAYTTEAAGASGAAALRQAVLAIKSGYADTVAVLGVEKWSDLVRSEAEAAIMQEMDYDYESIPGLTSTGQAGLIMQRYLHEHDLPADALNGFAVLAHSNGVNNPFGMFKNRVTPESYARSGMLCDPLNMYDGATYADGAAALILTRRELLPKDFAHPVIRVSGSAASSDSLSWHDRHEPMAFSAAAWAVNNAAQQAGLLPGQVSLFELDDSFSIYAALTLEASRLADHGKAWQLARDGEFAVNGRLPIMTMGGCLARGNPIGAKGVYQVVEAVTQLRGAAGANQVPNALSALTLALGGPASTAIAHVLEISD